MAATLSAPRTESERRLAPPIPATPRSATARLGAPAPAAPLNGEPTATLSAGVRACDSPTNAHEGGAAMLDRREVRTFSSDAQRGQKPDRAASSSATRRPTRAESAGGLRPRRSGSRWPAARRRDPERLRRRSRPVVRADARRAPDSRPACASPSVRPWRSWNTRRSPARLGSSPYRAAGMLGCRSGCRG